MRTSSGLVLLLILGVALRLTAAWIRPADLTSDNDGYLAHAEMVADGEGFAGPYTHRPTAFRPPAYPIALAGLRWSGLSMPVSVLIVNSVSSLAIVWLTWILCRQLQFPKTFAFVATAIATFDPLLVRYTILPMTEVLAAAMLTGAVVALKAAEQRPGISNTRVAGFQVVAGFLFGLGSLVRPILLISCTMLILWRLMLNLNGPSGIRRNFAITILPMIAAVMTISPWIIRNAVCFGKFIPATTHGGYTLALGNNPDFYRDVIDGEIAFPWPGPQLDAWQQRMIADSAAQGVPVGNEPAQDSWYYRQAFASMKAQPLSFLKSCLLRLRRFCAMTPGTNDGMPQLATTLVAMWYGFIGIGLVAAIGHSVSARLPTRNIFLRKRISMQPSHADLWLVVLSFMLLHSVYWTDARMRAPVMPVISIIAVAGLQTLIEFVSYITAGRFVRTIAEKNIP